MEVYGCPNCGMQFAMTADFVQRRRENHETFYCPSGPGQSFKAENEAERLRRLNQNLVQQQARLQDEIREANKVAGEAIRRAETEVKARKRIEKRIGAGVCPDCNRTFSNIARHMVSKHSERECQTVLPAKLKVVK